MPKDNQLVFKADHKRVFKNTIILYGRLIVTMGISLYTSRYVLNTLGVDDFGIYNVVGGIVMMLVFLNSAMAAATQRFLSFELGQGNSAQVRKVFSMSMTIHLLIALLAFVVGNTIGLWFLNTYINIPAERMYAANWVYQLSLLSFMVTMVQVPYNASIVAYERMTAYAYISIGEVLLKLLAVVALFWIGGDKLILYALFILGTTILVTISYRWYCIKQFSGFRYRFFWDKSLFKQLSSYAGWNLFGSGALVGMSQGANIILNLFFGPAINAAKGIASQVDTAVRQLVYGFLTALRPQIIKSYAAENKEDMFGLIYRGARFTFYLTLLAGIPVLFQTETLLRWWLKDVPAYTVIFVQLSIIYSLANCVTFVLDTCSQASGNIRKYQMISGILLLSNLPVSWVLLKLSYPPYVVFIVMIAITLILVAVKLKIVGALINLPIMVFLKKVCLNIIYVTGSTLGLCFIGTIYLPDNEYFRFIIITVVSLSSIVLSVFFIGLQEDERAFVIRKIKGSYYHFISANH